MGLHLIFGNSGSGKSTYIYEKILHMAQEDRKRNFYVIVPEQFTMQTQRELVERSKNHVIVNVDVVSFERLAYRIFDELGIRNTVMEETGKSLVLRKLAVSKGESLTVLRANLKRMGYIDELKSILSELMQYDISSSDLEEFLATQPQNTNLYYKLSDIQVMYAAFEEYLRGRYVTAERVLDVFAGAAEDSALLKNAVFALDGFTGFTPVQMKALHQCMHVVSDIYVTVTLDAKRDPFHECGMQDLFYMSSKMIRALCKAAQEERFPIENSVVLDPNEHSRLKNQPALFHLEQNLFRVPSREYESDCGDALQIVSLPTPREELEYAAWKICTLMREKNYRYKDFAIVSGNMDCYANYAESVFARFDLPYFADQKSTVLYHPCIELIRAALEMIETDFSYESVFRFLRTGFAGFSSDEIDFLENYALAKGIRGVAKWKKRFTKVMRKRGRTADSEEELQEELRRANDLRERFWAAVTALYEDFRLPHATVRMQTESLYRFLCSLNLEEQLKEAQKEFETRGEAVTAAMYRQIYRIVIDLLDKMADLLGEEELSVRDYADVLEEGFSTAKVGSVPPGADCVILGDIERTRLEGIKVLFFLGVNDGQIPKNTNHGGILSQYDREQIEQGQLTLAPTAREQSFLQRFYLYLNLTKPSEALYLTCARMDNQQKAARPSYLIGTLQKLFPGVSVTEIESGFVFAPVTPKSSLESYILGLRGAREGNISEEWKALHACLSGSEVWSPVVRELYEAAFSRFSGEELAAETAARLYGTVLTNSVTRLELFARCAYAHFLSYGLNLSERETSAFAALDMGSMFHDILQRYCQALEETSDWYSVTEETQETLLENAITESVLSMPNEELLSSARSAYVLERIRRIMKRSVWALTEQIRHGSFRPVGYEVDFIQTSELSVETLAMDSDRRMRLVGRIDRMDTYENEDSIYVRVIDYKSGATTFQLLNLYYGRQLQLVVYLNAAMDQLKKDYPGKEIVPAGIFYYRLDDPMVEETSDDEEHILKNVLSELRLNGLVSLEEEAYRRMDIGLGGKSDVIPLTLNKDGSVSRSRTSGASRSSFEALSGFVNEKIRDAGSRILSGEINALPFRDEKHTGCDYCPYRSVCGFDLKIDGYEFRTEAKLADEEIWAKISRTEGRKK